METILAIRMFRFAFAVKANVGLKDFVCFKSNIFKNLFDFTQCFPPGSTCLKGGMALKVKVLVVIYVRIFASRNDEVNERSGGTFCNA